MNHPLSCAFSLRALRVIYTLSRGYSLLSALDPTSSRAMKYSPHFLSQHFFEQFHQKLFFYCINSKALLICTFWRWKSLHREPSPCFSCLLLPISLMCTFTQHKQKTAPRLSPLVWERVVEVRLRGPDCSQTRWLSSVSLHLTPCQHEVTEQTRQPPPTCSRSYSDSLLVVQAWDAECELE